jgi:hypothetical protein
MLQMTEDVLCDGAVSSQRSRFAENKVTFVEPADILVVLDSEVNRLLQRLFVQRCELLHITSLTSLLNDIHYL